MLRSFVTVLVALAIVACGDDSNRRQLADAPDLPDMEAPIDMPIDEMIVKPTDFDLEVTKAGNGDGTVTSEPAGIDCGASCTGSFEEDTLVTLTAEPATGSLFTGWGGACSGTTPVCEVTITEAASVTATFTLETFTVMVSKLGAGDGTITGNGLSCDPTCSVDVDYGTAISLTATPIALSNFVGWGGDCTGTGTCDVTVTADTNITAAFALDDLSLIVATGGNGAGTVTSAPTGINCPGDCDQVFTANQMIALTATPAASSNFTGWSGACTGTGVCMVTMDAAKTVTATFTLKRYTLEVLRTGNGTVTSDITGIACGTDCDEMYDHGTEIELTAVAGTGSNFTGWSGAPGCTGTGPCTVTLTADREVTATFALNVYALDVDVGGTGAGTVMGPQVSCPTDCNGSFTHGTNVALTQMASTGSTFMGWGGACSGTGACSVPMTMARMVTATFDINSYNLDVTVTGMGTVTGPQINCGADCQGTYTHGTNVVLAHEAAPGYTFTGWTGACTGPGTCSVPMTMARMVTATFTINQYALNAAVAGTNGATGTVTATGISCPGDCTEMFPHDTVVSVTQTPAASSNFANWSGACTGTAACNVTMDAMKSVTANYTIKTHVLTVTPPTNGTITGTQVSCGSDCTGTYNHGTMVTLTATPSTGYSFTSWGGACAGDTDNSCTVTMDMARTVSATFTINSYTLTATDPANGTITGTQINCGADCTGTFTHGTMVTLTAMPDTGYSFGAWGGACAGDTDNSCTVTMDMARSVSATFTINSYTLTATDPANGTITGTQINCGTDCTGTFTHGTMVTLTAAPDTGYSFMAWGGACAGDPDNSCTVTMDMARSVSATFSINSYTLTATDPANGTITGTQIDCGADCTGTFTHGTMVTLTAAPDSGYSFASWGGACAGDLDNSCTVTMDGAKSVSATFSINSYTLTATDPANGSITGAQIDCGTDCTGTFTHGTMVTLTAVPDAGYGSPVWGGSCAGASGSTCVLAMTGNRTASVTFSLNAYTLTVINDGGTSGGQGNVTANVPAGFSCGPSQTCNATHNHGTSVVLTATTGTGTQFAGWFDSAGVCSGTSPTCTVTMTAARTVQAVFTAPNVMFVTSTTYRIPFDPAGQDPLIFADSECQRLATEAGLVGSGPGRNEQFRAYLSHRQGSTITHAANRFPNTNGWMRVDGRTVIGKISDIPNNQIIYPPRLNQSGGDISAQGTVEMAWTGSDGSGFYNSAAACVSGTTAWVNSQGSATIGLPSGNSTDAFRYTDTSCGGSNHLYCMGVGRNAQAAVTPYTGTARLAFTSQGTFGGGDGLATADALCQSEADANGLRGTWLALLAYRDPITTEWTPAIRRFINDSIPWVRVGDRQPFANYAILNTATVNVTAVAPNAHANGQRTGDLPLWTGANKPSTQPNISNTCNNWTNPGEFKGTGGRAFDTGQFRMWFGGNAGNIPCTERRHLVCLQRTQ